MSTGDLRNNLYKLQSKLKKIEFHGYLNCISLGKGDPESFLPLFHFILLDAFPLLADYFASKGYNLYGKKDSRFIECVYKLLRDEFTYKPAITKEQFFSLGFSERKIILTCDIIDMCLELNKKLIRVEYNKGYTTSTRKSQMAVNSKKKLGIKNGHSALNYYCEYSPEKENFQNPINIPTSYEYSSDPKRGYKDDEYNDEKIYQNELDGVMQYPPSRYLKPSWNEESRPTTKPVDYNQYNEGSNYCESVDNEDYNNTEINLQIKKEMNYNNPNYDDIYNEVPISENSGSKNELISYIKLLIESNNEIKKSIDSLSERLTNLELKVENSSVCSGNLSQTENNIMKIKNIIENEKSPTVAENSQLNGRSSLNNNGNILQGDDLLPINNNSKLNNDTSLIQEQCIAEEVSIDESIPSNTNITVQKSAYSQNKYSNNSKSSLYSSNENRKEANAFLNYNNDGSSNGLEFRNNVDSTLLNSNSNNLNYTLNDNYSNNGNNNIGSGSSSGGSSNNTFNKVNSKSSLDQRNLNSNFNSNLDSNSNIENNENTLLNNNYINSNNIQPVEKDTLGYLERVTQNLKETKNIFMGNVLS
ncbi:Centrosomal spindle body, CEP44-domain-containing protein [Neocallimastix sp. 'constans']|jgi:hypothetical protein